MTNNLLSNNIYKYSTNELTFYNWIAAKVPVVEKVRVLELGSGSGELWESLMGKFKNSQIILSDTSEERLLEARKKLHMHNFNFKVIDPHKINYNDAIFEVVIANHNLFFAKDLKMVLSEIKRVLRPGGIFICTTNSTDHLRELSNLLENFGINSYFEKGIINTFDFENGEKKLNKYFEVVFSEKFANVLEIPDIGSILSYLRSFDDHKINLLLQVRMMDVVKAISEQMVEKGSFTITALPSMFICLRR